MTAMPIRATLPPTAIQAQPNGAVDRALLEQVDGRAAYVYLMAALPARGMRAMHAAIKKDLGVTLSTTGRGRTLQMQWDIFGGPQARYRPCSKAEYDTNRALGKELTKFWPPNDYKLATGEPAVGRHHVAALLHITIPDSDYWTKIKQPNGGYLATAAAPGTSPHGKWCADDLALPDGPDLGTAEDPVTNAVVEWLFTNELRFGFAHSTPSEKWHVQWYVGDQVPVAVLAYEASLQHPPTPEKPPTTEDDMALVIYIAENPPAVLAGYSSPPQYPAFQLELLKDDETINDFRAAGAIDYPGGPLPATAFKRCTIIGLVPPGWIEGTHYRQAVG